MSETSGEMVYASEAPRLVHRPPTQDVSPASPRGRPVVWPRFGPDMQVIVRLRGQSRVYWLRGSFAVRFGLDEDGTVIARHDSLPVFGYGEHDEAALESFAAMFDFQYREVHGPDEELTPHALEVRAAFDRIVERVTEG